MNVIIASRQYSMISHDITNHCNARCKFCFNDWEQMNSHIMENDVFSKARSIIPFTMSGKFLFSCLFEPTVHPDFISFLYKIPYQYKDKVIFTTNLVKRLTDDELLNLCNAPVKYFNISLETYNEDKYRFLSGTKQSYFYDNISRLSKIAKKARKTNKIRVITMVLRSNMNEIPSLIKRVHEELSPQTHELRTPYISSPIEEFLADELLNKKELIDLSRKIIGLGYDNIVTDFGRNIDVLYSHLKEKESIYDYSNKKNNVYRVKIEDGLEKIEGLSSNGNIRNYSYHVRINSDGTGYFVDTDEVFDFNEIDDMVLFWSNKLYELQKKEVEQYIVSDQDDYELILYADECMPGEVTDLILFDEQFITLCGYYSDVNGFWKGCERVVLVLQDKKNGILLHTMTSTIDGAENVVFSTKISRDNLDDNLKTDVYAGYKDKNTLHMRRLTQLSIIDLLFKRG